MVVAVVLQILQTTTDCGFSRIHSLNQLLGIYLNDGRGIQLIPRLRFASFMEYLISSKQHYR